MTFSIPKTIYPVYSVPAANPVYHALSVGTAIKDMSAGAETPMKKANVIAVANAKAQFEVASAKYEIDFAAATIKAASAENVISEARKKKAVAITLLVTSIIGVVGVVVAAVITQTWPLIFLATPFLIGMTPSSYFTHIFRKAVSKLENDIAAPGAMPKPVLNLPVYYPSVDLDLQQTRITAQNALASMTTLSQLANSNYSNDAIVNYALLDRVTKMSPAKQPAFYAKCIQLINAQGQVDKEHRLYMAQADQEYDKLVRELHDWKGKQDRHIQTQEYALQDQERLQIQIDEARKRGEPIPVRNTLAGHVTTLLTRWELDRLRTEVATTYGRGESNCHSWHQSMIRDINEAYSRARMQMETQFTQAKAAAA